MPEMNAAQIVEALVAQRDKSATTGPALTKTGRFAKLSQDRVEARDWSARLLSEACRATDTSYSDVAATLGIHHSAVSAMARPGELQTLALSDVWALYRLGRQRLAERILRDAIAFVEAHARRTGMSPPDHLRRLVSRVGAVATALDGSEREAYVRAIKDLQAAVCAALLDCEGAR